MIFEEEHHYTREEAIAYLMKMEEEGRKFRAQLDFGEEEEPVSKEQEQEEQKNHPWWEEGNMQPEELVEYYYRQKLEEQDFLTPLDVDMFAQVRDLADRIEAAGAHVRLIDRGHREPELSIQRNGEEAQTFYCRRQPIKIMKQNGSKGEEEFIETTVEAIFAAMELREGNEEYATKMLYGCEQRFLPFIVARARRYGLIAYERCHYTNEDYKRYTTKELCVDKLYQDGENWIYEKHESAYYDRYTFSKKPGEEAASACIKLVSDHGDAVGRILRALAKSK